jgi:biopolymer transport protein TolR
VSVDLPQAKAGALSGKDEQLVVSVTKTGQLYLNDMTMSPDQLEGKLRAIAAQRPDGQVFVRADQSVAYGQVVRVMAAIKSAGIRRVGMVTLLPPGEK